MNSDFNSAENEHLDIRFIVERLFPKIYENY